MELSLIDPDAPVADQAAAIDAACRHVGFFHVPLSAIDVTVADKAWAAASRFFALPEDEKRLVEFPEPGYPYGYAPFKYETLARSLDTESPAGPDLKETLSVGPDCAINQRAAANDHERWIRSPSLWPQHPADLQSAWTDYYLALTSLADHLMSVMAVALDLTPDFFVDLTNRPMTSMRALRYPALSPEFDVGTSLRAGAHSDYGTLTILRTDDVPGLEIQALDGTWQQVTPRPDAFIVNLGDSIAQWTNDRWRSTLHRVSLGDRGARQSMAFFHMANWDATIECLPTCRTEHAQPRHAPVQAGPWLMRKFTATVG